MAVSRRRKECYSPYPQVSGCIVAIIVEMVVTLWWEECFTVGNHSNGGGHGGEGVKIGSTNNNGIAVAILVVVTDVQKQ